jgi:hypothetical protein
VTPTPTTTPTISITPTITPSPTPYCYCYNFTNTGATNQFVRYYNCKPEIDGIVVLGLSSTSICIDINYPYSASSSIVASQGSQCVLGNCPTPTPTVTPTKTVTPTITISNTPTNTVTPTPTITPTNAPIVPECAVIFNSEENVFFYDVDTNTTVPLNVQGSTNSSDIAHTTTKLWMSDSSTIEEWDITLSPFIAVFNRTISLPHDIGPGLGAIDNTTLIAVNRDTTPDSVVTLDITTTSAVSTYKFDMIAGRAVSGDILLTTTNKVIVTNNDGTNQFVTQYDYPSGSVEVDIQISPTMLQPWGIFQNNSEIYLMNGTSSNNVYHIDKNSPYTLTLTGDTGYSVYGASQVPSCITTNFIIAPTPSPTPTNTITPTLTPTPTSTPICNCYEISNTGATSGFWRMIPCSATTQIITFAPPGFSTSTCIGGSNYTGSTQMSFILKGECSDNKCPTPTPTPSITPTITPTKT